jgi:alcohol dehydrogenase
VTKRRNAISLAFSREAWRHLAPNFARVLDDPLNLAARAEMQLGACLAGLAIENSMLGGAHALANPLTATFGIAHGQAVAIMLPHVIRHNAPHVGPWYNELLLSGGSFDGGLFRDHPADALATWLRNMAQQAGLAGTLSECGVARDHLPQLAIDAARQWTGTFNPVELTENDLRRIYDAAF